MAIKVQHWLDNAHDSNEILGFLPFRRFYSGNFYKAPTLKGNFLF